MQAHEAIIEEREVKARLNRAREAREKADKVFIHTRYGVAYEHIIKEKADRNSKKLALVDLAMDDNQSGVMDCLLEALKTGTAFSRDGRRKRQARPAGGNLKCSQ